MKKAGWALSFLALALGGCGGGGGGGAAPPVTVTPTPTPVPTPTPTPTPTTAVSYLHVFGIEPSDGGQPNGALMQASDGNFYGTTLAGGGNVCRPSSPISCGTIFRITPGGTQQVLHSFGASPNEGYTPAGPLIQGSDGALYGMTSNGGAFGGGGTVYRVGLDGSYTTLHSFGASSSDGATPIGALVQGSDGNFYGATNSGGTNHCDTIPQAGGNCGTLFRMTPAGTTTILYSFGNNRTDGIQPNGSLSQASDGNFYGTTQNGGANGCGSSGTVNDCGTAFRLTSDGNVTILYSFGASLADGIAPTGGLIRGADGALYGRTVSGGGGRCGGLFGCGTIFRMTTAGQVSLIYKFALESRLTGYGPSSLILGRDGNFYGTTNSGGVTGSDLEGSVFRLTSSGTLTTLHSFGPLNEKPSAPLGLVQGNDGAFYGLTFYNGALGAVGARGGQGTVFKLTL